MVVNCFFGFNYFIFYFIELEKHSSGRLFLSPLGNRAMQKKLYSDAIELYDCAIALCENNAVYYCNRCSTNTYSNKSCKFIGHMNG